MTDETTDTTTASATTDATTDATTGAVTGIADAAPTGAVRRHDPAVKGFASDNYAGVHPEILAAIALANGGHQTAYGDDVYTEALQEVFRAHFGPAAQAWPVFNGTGANVVALRAMTAHWEAVVCAESAHIHTDEGARRSVRRGSSCCPWPPRTASSPPS